MTIYHIVYYSKLYGISTMGLPKNYPFRLLIISSDFFLYYYLLPVYFRSLLIIRATSFGILLLLRQSYIVILASDELLIIWPHIFISNYLLTFEYFRYFDYIIIIELLLFRPINWLSQMYTLWSFCRLETLYPAFLISLWMFYRPSYRTIWLSINLLCHSIIIIYWDLDLLEDLHTEYYIQSLDINRGTSFS